MSYLKIFCARNERELQKTENMLFSEYFSEFQKIKFDEKSKYDGKNLILKRIELGPAD